MENIMNKATTQWWLPLQRPLLHYKISSEFSIQAHFITRKDTFSNNHKLSLNTCVYT